MRIVAGASVGTIFFFKFGERLYGQNVFLNTPPPWILAYVCLMEQNGIAGLLYRSKITQVMIGYHLFIFDFVSVPNKMCMITRCDGHSQAGSHCASEQNAVAKC